MAAVLDIESVMAKSTDYDELVYVWKSWRDATGAKMKDLYQTYVTLANEAAKANSECTNNRFVFYIAPWGRVC